MAEVAVVSLIATIAQLVDFSSKVISRLKEYQGSAKGTMASFRSLEITLPLIIVTLRHLSEQAKTGGVAKDTQTALVPIIVICFAEIESLHEILSKLVPLASDTILRRGLKVALSIHQEKEIEKHVKTLKEYLDVLTFHSSACSSKLESRESPLKTVFMVPFDRDPNYLDRTDVMGELHQRLESHNRAVLTGTGGVG